MDTRFLESFVAVVDCGSIAEAARRLNLTPAGVAQQIRVLERDLGIELVFRSGRNVRPTVAAASILDRARSCLNDVRDLKSVATNGQLSGELRLGAMQTTLLSLVPDILSTLAKAHPQMRIDITREGSTQLYHQVLNGEIDAAVTSEPPFAIPKTLDWCVLREEPYVLLIPAALPPGDPLDILTREPFIRLHRSVYAGRVIDGYLSRMRIRPHVLFELDGIEAIAVMVDRGLGVAILPDWAPPWPEELTLRKVALPDRSLKRNVGLLWSRTSLRLGLINTVLRAAQNSVDPGRSRAPARPRISTRARVGRR